MSKNIKNSALFLAGIGKKCSKNVAFSVKTCRYRQENAVSGLNIENGRKRLICFGLDRRTETHAVGYIRF